ncbi:MAG TPA: hypothetical protein VK658_18250 [Chryseolinea sp.]|nr:hypothetical protein [Chryseolinea sp.]
MISEKGISRKNTGVLDFHRLREDGIQLLQALSGNQWTDFNLHDPGVTTYEILCYALTDLGYRTELVQETLTDEAAPESDVVKKYFFSREEIVEALPVTKWDFEALTERTHPMVLLAWFEEYPIFTSKSVVEGGYEIAVLLKQHHKFGNLNTDSLYFSFPAADGTLELILFDHDNNRLNWKSIQEIVACKLDQQDSDNFFVFENNNCQISLILQVIHENRTQSDQLRIKARVTLSRISGSKRGGNSIDKYQSAIIEALESTSFIKILNDALEKESYKANQLAKIKNNLLPFRNLCEDFVSMRVINEQDIKLDAEITLHDKAQSASVMLEKLFDHLDNFLLSIVRQSKQPMSDKGNILYASHLIEQLAKIDGVDAVRILNLNLYIDGVPTVSLKDATSLDCISLKRFSYYVPRVSRRKSNITFVRSTVPEKAETKLTIKPVRPYGFTSETDSATLTPAPPVIDGADEDIFRSLLEYHSIREDFPANYRLTEPLVLNEPHDAARQRIIQFRTFLMFFDKLIIDYLQNLHKFRDLLSVRQQSVVAGDNGDIVRKYIPEIHELDLQSKNADDVVLSSAAEREANLILRHKILDHLLARFATTYSHLPTESDSDLLRESLEAKIALLNDMPQVTRERGLGLAIRPNEQVWNSNLLSGFQKRIYALLGLKAEFHRHIQLSKVQGSDLPGFYIVEHILLVKKDASNILNKKFNSAAELLTDYIVKMSREYRRQTSYSCQVTIVFPGWNSKWKSNKPQIEQMIREELPAHILPYFHWLNKKNLGEFESCYEDWMKALLQLNS